MFLFKSHKHFTHKQSSAVGFVLSVLSLLIMLIFAYGFPMLMAWLNVSGVYHLDFLAILFAVTTFFSLQGLILFGFPLYYANDKKSHMTGFQILLYALMWNVLFMGIAVIVSVLLAKTPMDGMDMDQLLMQMQEEADSSGTLPVQDLEVAQ